MPKKKKSSTPRQKKLLKNLVKGMTITDAAIGAGYTTKHPGQAGHQALKGLAKTMPELLEAHGLTDDVVIEKYLKPGLEAFETKFAQFEGKFTDSENVVAWGPRRDFLDMLNKLKGSYAPVKQAVSADIGPLAVQIITNVNLPEA